MITKFTENYWPWRLFSRFIQTQKRYPNLETTGHIQLKFFLWTKLLENFPVDTRHRFNVYKMSIDIYTTSATSYRSWNDVLCLLGYSLQNISYLTAAALIEVLIHLLHLRKYIEGEFFYTILQKIKQKEQRYNPTS